MFSKLILTKEMFINAHSNHLGQLRPKRYPSRVIINQRTLLQPSTQRQMYVLNFTGWSPATLRAPSIPPVDDKTAKRRPTADVFKRPHLAPRKAKTIRSAFSTPLWQANSQSVIQSNNPISSCRFCSGFSRNLLIFSDDFQPPTYGWLLVSERRRRWRKTEKWWCCTIFHSPLLHYWNLKRTRGGRL